MTRATGYLRDLPDERDRPLYAMHLPGSPPPSVTLAEYALVLDQGGTLSCVAHAVAQGIHVARRARGLDSEMPSWGFLYWNSRGYHGAETEDGGTYPRTCLKSAVRFGAPSEAQCPWEPWQINRSPSWAAYRHAFDERGARGYLRLFETGSARLEAMRNALAAGFPVVFGTAVDEAFLDFSGGRVVGPPTEVAGLHAMLAVGYESGRFRVVNSWGTAWGEHGFCWLSDSYLTHPETVDLWVVDVAGGP